MAARILTNEEYAKLAAKVLGRDLEVEGSGAARWAANQMKQVHRLLCDGHEVEDLTPVEQLYAPVFRDAVLAKIPNDYGWEPGIEVEAEAEPDSETVKTAPPPKPKKNGR